MEVTVKQKYERYSLGYSVLDLSVVNKNSKISNFEDCSYDSLCFTILGFSFPLLGIVIFGLLFCVVNGIRVLCEWFETQRDTDLVSFFQADALFHGHDGQRNERNSREVYETKTKGDGEERVFGVV